MLETNMLALLEKWRNETLTQGQKYRNNDLSWNLSCVLISNIFLSLRPSNVKLIKMIGALVELNHP